MIMGSKITNKSYKFYNKLSRYRTIPYYYNVDDNKYFYGTAKNLKDTTPYKIHIVIKGDTLDSLALYYYNNPTLFWIIADFNRIRDPFITLKEGQRIKIPSLSDIEFE